MTHDIQTQLTDEQLAEAVGGGYPGVLTLTTDATIGAAAAGLDKAGTGTVVLSGSDTYTGRTRVIFGSEVGVF